MLLIGMLDSPFVRRVAVSMRLLGMAYERHDWSVGRDADRIRPFNPLGRVPVLVLDSGERLIESGGVTRCSPTTQVLTKTDENPVFFCFEASSPNVGKLLG